MLIRNFVVRIPGFQQGPIHRARIPVELFVDVLPQDDAVCLIGEKWERPRSILGGGQLEPQHRFLELVQVLLDDLPIGDGLF